MGVMGGFFAVDRASSAVYYHGAGRTNGRGTTAEKILDENYSILR
jgi:hypothetical protein